MSKFSDLGVGDTVFIRHRIRYGFNDGRSFFLPMKIDRVTKTQLIIETRNTIRIRKENGCIVGEIIGRAYVLGEIANGVGGKVCVSDQTLEAKEFQRRVKAFGKVRRFDPPAKIDIDNPNLFEALDLLTKAKELLEAE